MPDVVEFLLFGLLNERLIGGWVAILQVIVDYVAVHGAS